MVVGLVVSFSGCFVYQSTLTIPYLLISSSASRLVLDLFSRFCLRLSPSDLFSTRLVLLACTIASSHLSQSFSSGREWTEEKKDTGHEIGGA